MMLAELAVTRVALPKKLEDSIDWLLVGALVCVTVLAVRHEPNWNFVGRDTLVYSIAADLWSRGEVPYRDFIDHKPPAAYLAYRVFLFLGGRLPRSLWQGMSSLAGIASILLYVALRGSGRTAAAVAASLSFFLLVVTDPLQLGFEAQNNCETLAVFWGVVGFCSLLFYQHLRRLAWAALAGAAFALAVLSKQTAACWIVPLAAQLAAADGHLPWRPWLRRAAAAFLCFAGGGAVVLGTCVAYFAARDALPPFYEWVYRRNVIYSTPVYVPSLQFRWWIFQETWQWLMPKLAVAEALPFVAAILLLPFVSLGRGGGLARLAILWCATSLAGASAGLGVQSHYCVLLFPALALSLGAALEWILSFAPRSLRRAPIAVGVSLAVCALLLAPSLGRLWRNLNGDPARAASMLENWPMYRLGRAVAAAAAPDDRMLAFGDPFDPLFYSGLRPPGRYIYYPSAPLQPDAADYMRELRATKPRFIYIGSDTYEPLELGQPGVQGMLRAYLDEHYLLWRQEGGGRVFQRRDEAGS